ncbi:MAG: heme ABC exporter ATP-binding protein CcmA [Deltaproteobacteria bacterium]|jgi:heme exporter protein A|nr:heme ABC exporter ATP-binding protein CcmA [Deltaproteobacteria bacterium]
MLKLDGVSKRYGNRLVLRDINLTLEAGSVLLLVGVNGAGKSTLLRLAAGLTPPTSGAVACPDAAIGYLGHATGLYPGLSALDNLAFWQRLYRADARPTTLLAALDRVGLAGRAHDRAAALSRGMAQRLNLARLLLLRPELVLLDEPAAGLDPASFALLAEEIAAARDRGAAVIWASHHLDRDRSLADRLIELADRHVRYDGPAAAFTPEKRPC